MAGVQHESAASSGSPFDPSARYGARAVVFRSSKQIYAQIIDEAGRDVVAASSMERRTATAQIRANTTPPRCGSSSPSALSPRHQVRRVRPRAICITAREGAREAPEGGLDFNRLPRSERSLWRVSTEEKMARESEGGRGRDRDREERDSEL